MDQLLDEQIKHAEEANKRLSSELEKLVEEMMPDLRKMLTLTEEDEKYVERNDTTGRGLVWEWLSDENQKEYAAKQFKLYTDYELYVSAERVDAKED